MSLGTRDIYFLRLAHERVLTINFCGNTILKKIKILILWNMNLNCSLLFNIAKFIGPENYPIRSFVYLHHCQN